MSTINDNQPRPPIQILVASCTAFGDPNPRCAWLHGFALLTLQPCGANVRLTGTVLTGERYADDRPLIEALERELDSNAVLAGHDLTDLVRRLGRLPIDAADQGPSLALLQKLHGMIAHHCPLDLALPGGGNLMLAIKAQVHDLHYCVRHDGEGMEASSSLSTSFDNINPTALAAELADTAGAIALTVGELYLEQPLRQSLLDCWQEWRGNLHDRWLVTPVEEDCND